MHDVKRAVAALFGTRLLIQESVFRALWTLAGETATDGKPVGDERGLRWMAGGRARRGSSTAVLGLYGFIDQRSSALMDWIGGTSTEAFGDALDKLVADPQVRGIVIDVDSPGGTAKGTGELSQRIYDARASKPIVAISNGLMASAAYYVASAAHKVFVSPSSDTGSIGVFSAYSDFSEAEKQAGISTTIIRSEGSPYKVELSGIEPLTKEGLEYEQGEVNAIYDEFVSAVARNRGVTVATVRKDYGKGRTMRASAAVASGMADRVATLEDVVRRMESGKLTLGSMTGLDAAFEGPTEPDDKWRDFNASLRKKSELRRKGIVA